MSFVRLDHGEFPPLNKINKESNTTTTTTTITKQNEQPPTHSPKTTAATPSPTKSSTSTGADNDIDNQYCEDIKFKTFMNKVKKQLAQVQDTNTYYCDERIIQGNDFVNSRIGVKLCDYTENLEDYMAKNLIGKFGDYILAPVEPVRSQIYTPHKEEVFKAIPDLVLSTDLWQTRVALDLGLRTIETHEVEASKQFEKLFRHALYLPSSVITVACPDSEVGMVAVASIINDRLEDTNLAPLVLFKIELMVKIEQSESQTWQHVQTPSPNMNKSTPATPSSSNDLSQCHSNEESFQRNSSTDHNESSKSTNECKGESGYGQSSGHSSPSSVRDSKSSWNNWNDLRAHLKSSSKFGVCLVLNDDLMANDEELSVWTGEPVRMIIVPTHRFVRSYGRNSYLQLNLRIRSFIKEIMIANSFKTSLVLEYRPGEKFRDYLIYLEYIISTIKGEFTDYLWEWNDIVQPPLQPLSSNLDSSTYGVFEMDSMKYQRYQEAMKEALNTKIRLYKQSNKPNKSHQFIVMVLGAGRGPLVESFIKAFKSIETNYRLKIYALDKNPSSVTALRYKQANKWIDENGLYTVEVVEADMRSWNPGLKADIIATELLGSLSDNELSPECLDGVWKFATPDTISIPQDYSSYIEPVLSHKLHQEVHNMKKEPHPYDQIYVAKMSNFYSIASPQELFHFEHKDLSINPEQKCNERFVTLTFWSKTDTLCHGFAGYFFANLYGNVTLSTLRNKETPNMHSWFPAFIPIEQPINMPKGTRLDVHFWRKESGSMVWYQWATTSPVRSRMHSPKGVNSGMSKCS